MEVLELINSGSQKLKENNICSYKIDSEILLAKILNKKREEKLSLFSRSHFSNLENTVTVKFK